MNELKKFNYPIFGDVRVVTDDDSAWFVGKDVAEALQFNNTRAAILRHVDPEDRFVLKPSPDLPFKVPNRGITIVNEAGLYSMIFGSRSLRVKDFKRWIYRDVLPSLRKGGKVVLSPEAFFEQFYPHLTTDERAAVTKMMESLENSEKLALEMSEKLKAAASAPKLEVKALKSSSCDEKPAVDRTVIVKMVGRYAQNFNRNYASAWRSYKGMLICTAKIDLDDRMCNYMTASGRSSRPKVTSLLHEDEVPKALQVIVRLCKEANLKTADIIKKYSAENLLKGGAAVE